MNEIGADPRPGPRRRGLGMGLSALLGGAADLAEGTRTVPIEFLRPSPVQPRRRFAEDLEGLARQFGLSAEELDALRDKDVKRLSDLGVHQYYLPQIFRLFYGTKAASNAHPALEAWKRAYPEEFERAQAIERAKAAGRR